MKRVGLPRITAAALGGLAAVMALLAFCVVASVRTGEMFGGVDAPFWAVPLVAGAAVGVLSWFLLAGAPVAEEPDFDSPSTVACANCGNSVMEDWRLCPHCGSSSMTEAPEGPAPTL